MQLLPALHSGGVERSTLEIAQALVRAGHRAVVVSAGGRLVEPLLAGGAEHLTLDVGRKSLLTLRLVPALRRLFDELGADIVHARSRLPAWLAWHALRGLPSARRPRFVTTVHGLNSPGRYSAVMTYGERVICVSGTVHDYVLRHYPATDPGKLRTIPRGIDINQFPRRPRGDPAARAWALSEVPALRGAGPLLLLPGRGTRLKGHHDGLRLPAALRGQGGDARLWLPGRANRAARTTCASSRPKPRDWASLEAVAFTPPTTRIAEAYAASDLVLQLSRKPEAFGRTVLEALSVGRPVLGWDHGGVGELLRELQPAGAAAPFDEAALAQQAARLLAHPPTLPARLPIPCRRCRTAP